MKTAAMFTFAGTLSFVMTSMSMAGVIWDEAIDGTLSTDVLHPTNLGALAVGGNELIGASTDGLSKYFTITIGEGTKWTGLVLDDWESADNYGFLAVLEGDWFHGDTSTPDVSELLGYVDFGSAQVGEDLLVIIGETPGAQGFTDWVGPGTYSFWMPQPGPPAIWGLDFVVESTTVVPGAGGLFALAGMGLVRRRRR